MPGDHSFHADILWGDVRCPKLVVESSEMIPNLMIPFDERGGHHVSQYFGSRPTAYPASGGHNGIDFGHMAAGTPIYAARHGIVFRADFNPDGYGRSVWIKHYDDEGQPSFLSIYGHLSRLLVKPGELVKARDLIGLSGGDPKDPYAGNTDGTHLHFEIRLLNAEPSQKPGERRFNARNPFPYLMGWDGKRLPPLAKGVISVARSAKIRAEPNDDARDYGELAEDYVWHGNPVTVYDEKNGYYRIDGRFEKWVRKDYITITQRYPPAKPKVKQRAIREPLQRME